MFHKNIIIYIILVLFFSGCNEFSTTSKDINLILKGDKNISLIVGDKFEDPGAEAYDRIDGNITNNIQIKSDLNISKIGNYTIEYSITNSRKETLIIKRYIEVKNISYIKRLIPIDSNLEYSNNDNILYYADPKFNRVLKIDYKNWKYEELNLKGLNPHSIDRAGDSDNFYVRTQDSYSFDIVNFKNREVKTISLIDHKPRAIGAYNKKYNIQLLSAKDMPVVDIIDVKNNKIIDTVGIRKKFHKNEITSNGGNSSATGHALWFDVDHFGLIDRVHNKVLVYKVVKNSDGSLKFKNTFTYNTITALHSIVRNKFPLNKDDLKVFYALGEGDINKNRSPYIKELIFDNINGKLIYKNKIIWLTFSKKKTNNIKPSTHHASVTPDGKYLMVPSLDGKVYIIDRKNMKYLKYIDAKLGAAHIEFSKSRNLAIITNHYSNYITIVDLRTFEVVKNLQIGFNHKFNSKNIKLFQPHFSYISSDGKFYYTFATQDGEFIKVNLDTLEIEDMLFTDGEPEQAHS